MEQKCVAVLLTLFPFVVTNSTSSDNVNEVLFSMTEFLPKRNPSEWFEDAKIGVKLSWGAFSVPALGSTEFGKRWKLGEPRISKYMKENYPPHFTYQKFAPELRAQFFNPDEIAKTLANSGAKYVITTAKYKDSFSLWPSKYSWPMTSADLGPKRDLLGELERAIRNVGLKFGVYYALNEWFHPRFIESRKDKWKNAEYMEEIIIPDLKDLVDTYKPDILWFPFDECNMTDSYLTTITFFNWLEQSAVGNTIIFNDGWSSGTKKTYGDFHTIFEFSNFRTLRNKSEVVLNLNRRGPGHQRDSTLEDFLTTKELIASICRSVSQGANVLLDVGMTSDGRIPAIHEEQLADVGEWLNINGEAVYGTRPWSVSRDDFAENVWYSQKSRGHGRSPKSQTETRLYAFILQWPDKNILRLKLPKLPDLAQIHLIGQAGFLDWTREENDIISIQLPLLTPDKIVSDWAWVLRISMNK